MQLPYSVVPLAASCAGATYETIGNVGPAAFLWPPERPFSAETDTISPCGSTRGVQTRTEFPMTNGRLALLARNKTRAVHVAISHSDNPVAQDAFDIFDGPQQIQLGVGHTCIWAPDAPAGVAVGANATFQVFYTTVGAHDVHYACADVTYVDSGAFDELVPCFNATRPSSLNPRTIASPTAFPYDSPPWAESDTRYTLLSPGQITAITIGSIVFAALIASGLIPLWRRVRNRRVEPKELQELEKAASESFPH
ncbi:hypothetical protein CBER1_02607 [Cercospora berteroae]|uniref:Copper acquisition factor BIM1-like domain-containing protein n=1 Tax=Cercospora berteroae TaxID=357750 RepID=A0A2S6CEJ4_9PEZI|nr:hypothetical protein CBER1_02607 [Cercospora berteroae]